MAGSREILVNKQERVYVPLQERFGNCAESKVLALSFVF
jgi:hypothetical protein